MIIYNIKQIGFWGGMLFALNVSAQSEKILVQAIQNKKQYKYIVKDGQTLFSISRLLNINIVDVVKLNPLKAIGKLRSGDTLELPTIKSTIQNQKPSGSSIEVVHIGRSGESIFTLKKMYNTSVSNIKAMNKNVGELLSDGEKIKLGYINPSSQTKVQSSKKPSPKYTLDDLKKELSSYESFTPGAESKEPVATSTQTIPSQSLPMREVKPIASNWKDRFLQASTLLPPKSENGVAIWVKGSQIDGGLYLLHPNAPINSIIEVTNPAFNRTIYGKVIGNIPPNVYPSEIKLIMTPSFAKALGAIDQRFFVKLKYQPGRSS